MKQLSFESKKYKRADFLFNLLDRNTRGESMSERGSTGLLWS